MKPIKLKVETKTQKYQIVIGSNLITDLSKIIKNNSLTFNQCLLVVDKNVPKKFVTKIKNSLKKKIQFYILNILMLTTSLSGKKSLNLLNLMLLFMLLLMRTKDCL